MREHKVSRRRFLKSSVAGAFALGLPTVIVPRRAHAYSGGSAPHPNIDPLRVVGVHDTTMIEGVKETSSWQQQEQMVRADVVAANLDRMACALAQEREATYAWRKIFLKPPGKSWKDAVVAIKTNQIAQQRTRSPVMAKVCHVLTDTVGVKAANIHIYDACHGGKMSRENRYQGLPEGVHLADTWGGSDTPTPVPSPFKDGQQTSKCLGHLVRGEVDILVDIALCKAHGAQFGGLTHCLKNHFGTFSPGPAHRKGGAADYLIAINKTPEILGDVDPKTGKVLFPRQQLCIIDTLWASKGGPNGPSSAQPGRLFMGTFGPAVDYQVGKRFLQQVMGWRINDEVVGRFLTDFGFSPSDLPNNGQIIEAARSTA